MSKQIGKRISVWVLVAAVAIPAGALVPGRARAQDETPEGVENMVVTSQRRESSLQTTNISISAFSSTELEQRGVERVDQLTAFVPNVNFQINSNGNGFFVAQRGVAQADATAITRDPATAIYIDGVYWGMTAGNLMDVLDIERIEVLRGPQGDLYGRNSSAGAINIVTRKPSGEYGFRGSVKYGKAQRADMRLFQEFPILGGAGIGVDDEWGTLSGAIGVATINRDAYYPNDIDADIDSQGRVAGRGALTYENGNFDADLILDYSWMKEQTPEMQLTQAGAGFLDLNFNGTEDPTDVDLRPFVGFNRAGTLNLDGPSTTANGLKDDRTENIGVSYTMSYDFDEVPMVQGLELRSITGYRRVDSLTFSDRDGTPFDIFSGREDTVQWQVTQELNLLGTAETPLGGVDFIVGYFFFHEQGNLVNTQSADPTESFFSPVTTDTDIDNDAHALFTHLAWIPPIFEERIKFELGLRYTWEERGIDQNALINALTTTFTPEQLTFVGSEEQDFEEFTPSVRLSFQATDQLNVYHSISKGYLSGGFNGRAVTNSAMNSGGAVQGANLSDPYDEETLWTFETGFKFQGLDNRLRLNLAGFFTLYDDLQRTGIAFLTPDTTSGPGLPDSVVESLVINAERARIWGFEVEALAAPFEGAFINVAYGYTNAEYKRFTDFAGNRQEDNFRFANAPRHNISVGLQYTTPRIMDAFNVTGRLDYYYQTLQLLQNGDKKEAGQNGYGLLHARVTLSEIDLGGDWGNVDIVLWGQNLLDRDYKPFGIDFGSFVVQTFGERRSYGGELVWRFGSML